MLRSYTFTTKTRLNLEKDQANGKQHSEIEPFLFENYSHSLSTL